VGWRGGGRGSEAESATEDGHEGVGVHEPLIEAEVDLGGRAGRFGREGGDGAGGGTCSHGHATVEAIGNALFILAEEDDIALAEGDRADGKFGAGDAELGEFEEAFGRAGGFAVGGDEIAAETGDILEGVGGGEAAVGLETAEV